MIGEANIKKIGPEITKKILEQELKYITLQQDGTFLKEINITNWNTFDKNKQK